MKLFIIIRRNFFTLLISFFLLFLIVFSKSNLSAAKDGINLWWTCIVPSMFPFFIATELLNYTNIVNIFGKLFSKVMRPMFNLPGEAAYAILMGFISGSPVGARVTSDIYESGKCTKDEAERMLCFTNNSGPLFILGSVGILMYKSSTIGILLLSTHILSAITVGIIIGQLSKTKKSHSLNKTTKLKEHSYKSLTLLSLGDVLSLSVSKAITLTLQIGGFIALFSVILSVLQNLHIESYIQLLFNLLHIPSKYVPSVFDGIIELTHGTHMLSQISEKKLSYNIAICSFLIGFGSISIMMQVLSIVSKYKLSIKKYMIGKIIQGIISTFYVLLFVKMFPFFNLDLP